MLTAHHTVAFLVLGITWVAALLAGLAYVRRKEPRSIVTHLLALAQSVIVAQVALGLLLLSEHKRAPERLHYLYGTLRCSPCSPPGCTRPPTAAPGSAGSPELPWSQERSLCART